MNKILQDYYEVRKKYDIELGKLDEEVTRIVKIITSTFKRKDYWWAYDYYEDADETPPQPHDLEDGVFPVFISADCETSEWDYSAGIPVEFFDMKNEEIKSYILKEIEISEKEEKILEEKLKQQRIERKRKKEEAKQNALKKLSKEEIKALGI